LIVSSQCWGFLTAIETVTLKKIILLPALCFEEMKLHSAHPLPHSPGRQMALTYTDGFTL